MKSARLLALVVSVAAVVTACGADGVSSSGSGGAGGSGIAGTTGHGGTTGSAGAVGAAGTMGAAGTTGRGGATGTGGTAGNAGTAGAAGASGVAGTTGAAGDGAGGTAGSAGGGTGGTAGRGGRGGGGGTAGQSGSGGGLGGRGGGTAGGGAAGTTTGTAGTGGGTGGGAGGAAMKSAGCGKTPTLKNGTITLTSSNMSRQYIIDIPTNYDNTHPYRLVFGIHWVGGTMTDVATGQTVLRNVWAYYGLKQLANNSTIFVAPQGISNGWSNTGGQDVQFFKDMVSQIEGDLCVDTTRVFSIGFSFGGAMTYSLACSMPDVFRAVTVQDGGMLSGCSGGTKPVAYLGVHGVVDGTLNISGGRQMRDKFVMNNGCTKPATVPETTAGSKSHVCYPYEGCSDGHPVEWCTFDGDHKAAPADGACETCDDGNKTWVPGEAWKFFTQF